MIFVFKTSVKTKREINKIKPHLQKIIPGKKWNFDLEDCDRILRVDSEEDVVTKISGLLNAHEFDCEELQ